MRENAPEWKQTDGDALARLRTVAAQGQRGLFCAQCGAPETTAIRGNRGEAFCCPNGHYESRCLRFDDEYLVTLEDDGLVHDIAVLICTDSQDRILLVRRSEFPWGWSLPRQHLRRQNADDPFPGAALVGLRELPGASRWGSDRQRWHIYKTESDAPAPLKTPESFESQRGEESNRASWQTRTQIAGLAAAGLLVPPTHPLITSY